MLSSRETRHFSPLQHKAPCALCLNRPAAVYCVQDDSSLCVGCDMELHGRVKSEFFGTHERMMLPQHEAHQSQEPVYMEKTDSDSSEQLPYPDNFRPDLVQIANKDMDERTAVKQGRTSLEMFERSYRDFDALDFDDAVFGCPGDLLGLDLMNDVNEATDGVVPVHSDFRSGDSFASSSSEHSTQGYNLGREHSIDSSHLNSSGASTHSSQSQGPSLIAEMPSLAMPMLPSPTHNQGPNVKSEWSPPPSYEAGLLLGTSPPPGAVLNREARVLRYREKRKRRTFEKTIRYESRKAYAEVRPRIKGRFATKEEVKAMKAAAMAAASLQETDLVVPDLMAC